MVCRGLGPRASCARTAPTRWRSCDNGATLVRQSYRWAGVGARVPKGALVHALRHTMATRLAEDGASASEIQHILGHGSLNTAQV